MSSIVSLHGCRWPRRRTVGVVAPTPIPSTPIVPLMVTQGAPKDRTGVFTVGSGLTPVEAVVKTSTNFAHLDDPRLSPDETEILYGYVSGLSPSAGRIEIKAVDGTGSTTTLKSGLVPFTSGVTLSPCWSPDGTEIALLVPPSTFGGSWSVAKINRDGTGYTVLYTISTGLSGLTVRGLSWSPSGDYIALRGTRLSNGPDTLHVLNSDGSGGSAIVTGPSGTGQGGALSTPAWKRGSDVLGFCLFPASGDILWRTCNPDGTGLTTIYTDSARVYSQCERLSWLSDDSAIVAIKSIAGPDNELATIDAAGGGPTDSGIQLGAASPGLKPPYVMVTSQEDPRIYYTTIDGSGVRTLSSVLEDFSDARVDWDGADYTAATTQHHGTFEYDVN